MRVFVTLALSLALSACTRPPEHNVPEARASGSTTPPAAPASDPTSQARPSPSDPETLVESRRAFADAEAQLATARLRTDRGAFASLVSSTTSLIERFPNDPRPRQVRAAALLALGRARDAKADALQLVAANDKNVIGHGLVADVALALGDVAGCGLALEKMMDLSPGLPVYARVADLRFRTGDVEGSLEMWRTAFQAGHKSVPEALAYTATGAGDVFLFGKGDLEQAERSYDAALAAVPGYPNAVVGKARVALSKDLPCAAVVDDVGTDPDVIAVAAECAKDAAPPAKLAQDVLAVADRDPRAASLVLSMWNTNPKDALALAQAAATDAGGLDDDDALAFALFRNGRADDAVVHARRALSSATADVRIQARMALVLAAAKDKAAATEGRELLQTVAVAVGLPPKLRADVRMAVAR